MTCSPEPLPARDCACQTANACHFFHPYTPMATSYTEASVKTLSSLEHIRLRPGMYIGRLGNGAHGYGH